MNRILVLFAHPALHRSRVQAALLAAARSVDDVTVHDLYDAYPDFDIDVAREQSLLLAHDVIVLQHPFYWYSTPAIIKQWEDLVLEHGWAYGRTGTQLHGKAMWSVISTGGHEHAYTAEGRNRHTMDQLLAPIEQTALLCGMRWLPPFVVHGTHVMTPDAIADAARRYAEQLTLIRDGALVVPQHG